MMLSLKRINAIVIKDWKDLFKNSYILLTMSMPILFAYMLAKLDANNPLVNTMPINLALVISGAFIQAAIVAEEKEKNTLRGLLLSPAKNTEIFIGKSALTTIITSISIIIIMLIIDFEISNSPLLLVSLILNLVIYISIGTYLGLVSKTVMETTIIGIPVMAIFGMASMLKEIISNESILFVIDYLPSEQLNSIALKLDKGGQFNDISENILTLCIWATISIAFCFFTYKKRSFDK